MWGLLVKVRAVWNLLEKKEKTKKLLTIDAHTVAMRIWICPFLLESPFKPGKIAF